MARASAAEAAAAYTSVRSDWVQADLRCLQCGRALGRLLGPASGPRAAAAGAGGHRFSLFRPADPAAPSVRLLGHERFRCPDCRGNAVLDEVRTFSTYDYGTLDYGDEGQPRRRGRPPKPWRRVVDQRVSDLAQLGLAS